MALAIYPTTPSFIGPYGYQAEDPVHETPLGGSLLKQRVLLAGREARVWYLKYRTTEANRLILDAFWRARRGTSGAFLFKDPKDYARTGIALTPASDGSTATFLLPTTGEYAGDYPINDAATLKLYRAGILNAGAFSLVPDARSITTASVPAGGGAAMTGDYQFRRRVKFAEAFRWEEFPYGVFSTEIVLEEAGTA